MKVTMKTRRILLVLIAALIILGIIFFTRQPERHINVDGLTIISDNFEQSLQFAQGNGTAWLNQLPACSFFSFKNHRNLSLCRTLFHFRQSSV